MDPIYILKSLLRRLWIIILVPIIAGGAAYLFTSDMERSYKSTAQLSTGITMTNQITLNEQRFNYREALIKFSNLIETMQSELIVSMVSFKLLHHDLTEQPFRLRDRSGLKFSEEEILSHLEKKLENFDILNITDELDVEIDKLLTRYGYVNWMLNDNLTISRIKDTDFLKVQYSSEVPMLSAYVVNAISNEYIRYNKSMVSSSSSARLEFYANLVDEKKSNLDDKTALLNRYKSENTVFNYQAESEAKLAQISEYEVKRQDEIKNISALKISLATYDRKINNFSTEETLSNNSKIIELRKKINQLNAIYIEGGSSDSQLEATIDNLREELQIEMSKLQNTFDSTTPGVTLEDLQKERERIQLELDIAQANLASINGSISNFRRNISGLGSKESTIESLEKEVEKSSDEYLKIVEKYNDIKSEALIIDSPVKLMIPGKPNDYPESSKAIMIIAASVIGSGFLCVFVLVFFELIDLRIKTPNKFENYTQMKLIGYINDIETKDLDLKVLFESDKTDPQLEIYRQFLRIIRFEIQNTDAKTLLFTSSKQSEGKTFVILSLAYSLSMLNKRILIIDTNFKHNSLTQLLLAKPLFQKYLEQGSKNKLLEGRGGSESDSDNPPVVSPTSHRNIDIIGSISGIESPSEIFADKDFTGLLSFLKNEYDYIFMEGAALNDYSDTRDLVEFADLVIPVFSANSVLAQVDRDSIKFLKNLNGKLIGSILNKVKKADLKA